MERMITADVIREIIKLAKRFECCPHCGNYELKVSEHYCEKCKERIVVPEDAHWFANFLKEHYKDKLEA